AASLPDLTDRLRENERRIKNLVDQLADGALDSRAIRDRLGAFEREKEELRAQIAEAEAVRGTTLAMPDDTWVRAQLADLPSLLIEDAKRAVPLLMRLLGRVTAEAIVPPDKKRGFIRLHVRLEAAAFPQTALGSRLPEALMARLARA